MSRTSLHAVVVAAILGVAGASVAPAQVLPNPYRQVDGWAKLPDGREMGAVGKVTMDPDGEHLWAVIRCDAPGESFGFECLDSDLDSVVKFDMDGNVAESFGGGMFIWPHGIDVDSEGNVWVTDAIAEARTPAGIRGHQVIKFSPTGEVLMTLGTPGEAGGGPDHFNAPADVVVADSGDVFVADSESDDLQNPGWEMGIRIGDAATGWVTEFILYPWGDPRSPAGNGAEFVAVDRDGNIYGGEPRPRRIQKYVRVRP